MWLVRVALSPLSARSTACALAEVMQNGVLLLGAPPAIEHDPARTRPSASRPCSRRRQRGGRVRVRHRLLGAVVLLSAVAAPGCGSDSGPAKSGGTLTVINASDFQYADPGASYY